MTFKLTESPSEEVFLYFLIVLEAWVSTDLTWIFKGCIPLIFYGILFFTFIRTIPKWTKGQTTDTDNSAFSNSSVAGCKSEPFKAVPRTEE